MTPNGWCSAGASTNALEDLNLLTALNVEAEATAISRNSKVFYATLKTVLRSTTFVSDKTLSFPLIVESEVLRQSCQFDYDAANFMPGTLAMTVGGGEGEEVLIIKIMLTVEPK